ncbi:class I adenylate-forming enzyme family protein [candidate division CSSED10-310 bacterium]|uniref:Class I adenylate-forming enzyme family protein n=1 Tax=candidate division CSSED10-310 bacterium TaxID=2855610 RepID=A0ABV6Z0J4_UNCC1
MIYEKTPLHFLRSFADTSSDSMAVMQREQAVSYGQLLDHVQQQASYFHYCGVRPQTRVALFTDDGVLFTISLFAIWGLEAVCIPVNITQPPHLLKQIEQVVTPDIGFFSVSFASHDSRQYPMKELILTTGGARSLATPSATDRAFIMFTSGTSGTPKAVPMTHWALGHNASETASRLKLLPYDRILINTPPYFTSSIIHMLTMFARGACIVFEPGFLFGSAILDTLVKFECTGFGGVPVHLTRMLGAAESSDKEINLRFLMNSGEHLPVPTIKSLMTAFPRSEIYCFYGLTEVAGRLCSLNPDELVSKIGSVGKPLKDMVITIRDEMGQCLPPFEQGEVFVLGPGLMQGYLNSPEANARVMKSYGFATGDLGFLDDEGYLYLQGRKDDVFKVAGEKVSVKMIEETILGADEFEDFVVKPLFDEHMGHVPCLYYVLKKKRPFHKKQLLKKLRSELPASHIPVHFVEVNEIPRTASGKVIRSKL